MQLFFTISILHILLLLSLINAKRGGSGGGGSRGGGGAPSGGGGGSRPSGGSPGGIGGSRPAVNRPVGGSPVGGGTHFSGPSSSGGGFLQSRTSQLVAAGLGGAVVGAATYGLISSANSHYRSPQTGQTYYYGERYYPNQGRTPAGLIVCKYEIKENDTKLNSLYYDKNNGAKVKEVVFECKFPQEACFGLECRPNPNNFSVKPAEKKGLPWWGGLLVALLFIGLIGAIGYCIYSQVKKSSEQTDHVYPEATYTVQQSDPYQQQQNQPYPNSTNQGQSTGYFPDNANYPPQSAPFGGYHQPNQPQAYPAQSQMYPPGPPTQSYGFNSQYQPAKYNP